MQNVWWLVTVQFVRVHQIIMVIHRQDAILSVPSIQIVHLQKRVSIKNVQIHV